MTSSWGIWFSIAELCCSFLDFFPPYNDEGCKVYSWKLNICVHICRKGLLVIVWFGILISSNILMFERLFLSFYCSLYSDFEKPANQIYLANTDINISKTQSQILLSFSPLPPPLFFCFVCLFQFRHQKNGICKNYCMYVKALDLRTWKWWVIQKHHCNYKHSFLLFVYLFCCY